MAKATTKTKPAAKKKMTPVVELGDRVKHVICGFTGIAVSRHDFIAGPANVAVYSENPKMGKDDRHRQFDEGLLVVVKKGVLKSEPTIPSSVQLGDRIKDRVTSFEGICTGKHTYIQGCLQHTITIENRKTKEDDAVRAFDSGRLEIVQSGAIKINEAKISTGGPERYIPVAQQ